MAGFLALLSSALFRGQSPERRSLAINTAGRAGQVRVRPVPPFALQLFGGGVFRPTDQRGRVMVVNFWASWCPPCREEAPELEAAWRGLRSQGIVFVGVNVWDSEQAARTFLQNYGITYPNGPDPRGRILVEFGVTGIPETYAVDRQGRLVRRWMGPITRQELANLLEGLRRPVP
ncbi:MAG: TlpA family protein disulfide reductase [Armatimonadetes bacterium]|nr:TlpA family protein disulfide reductase [Armatimonadota bacterium]MDW8154598.1 TlpA disulfide reductase family protein [Armatimonadota bacterium]